MIIFQTRYQKIYNYVLHHFLKLEAYNSQNDIGDLIENILPKYLYREQYQKCLDTFQDLYNWTEDKFYHDMKAFHQIVLYHFIEYLAEKQESMPAFQEIYFDKQGKKLIEDASQIKQEDDEEITLKETYNQFYDI